MNIHLVSSTLSLKELDSGKALIKAFFHEPDLHILTAVNDLPISSEAKETFIVIDVLNGQNQPQEWQAEGSFAANDAEITKVDLSGLEMQRMLAFSQIDNEAAVNLLFKRTIYKLLAQVSGHQLPWGILTGIRPSKLVHKLEDLGANSKAASQVLKERYAIQASKIKLLQEVIDIQRPYLQEIVAKPQAVAVYIGIPFCPTRCTYCSFPAYSLGKDREELKHYLQALSLEIQAVQAMMNSLGLIASAVYLGGGTPTVLNTNELANLLKQLRAYLPHTREVELTVEAGRPDTITKEKLEVFKQYQVNRLSINPQTMHNETLKRIGRAHQVADIIEVYKLAREIADCRINMDLILGLPGETIADIETTLAQIEPLQPDNLTVHALAIKRGSKEHEKGFRHADSLEIEQMQELVLHKLKTWGYSPYYLYRQKNIAGNLENIGYALPGRECIYNIGIMEERQSVIGIGAGASSKIVNPKDFTLQNMQHPANWQAYLNRWPELHRERWKEFEKYY